MVTLLGQSHQGVIYKQEEEISVIQFSQDKVLGNGGGGHRRLLSFNSPYPVSQKVLQVSIEQLNKSNQGDQESKANKEVHRPIYLIGIVASNCTDEDSPTRENYSASLYIFNGVVQEREGKILAKKHILTDAKNELRIHILGTKTKEKDRDADTTVEDIDDDYEENCRDLIYKNKVLLKELDQGCTLYEVETQLFAETNKSNIEIHSSEPVTKGFWWAQWIPQYDFLAFAHLRKPRQSCSYDDEELFETHVAKPLLSVLQFHGNYPRESVLNMPLEIDATTPRATTVMTSDPTILSSKSSTAQIKLLAHSSGAVSIFQILPPVTSDSATYSINMLHHNKTLQVQIKIPTCKEMSMKVDVALFSADEYVLVVGWPHFAHFIDCGTMHEPSHHLLFSLDILLGQQQAQIRSLGFLGLSSSYHLGSSNTTTSTNNIGLEKSDLSSKIRRIILFDDLSHCALELNSALLLPLLEKCNLKFKLGVLHHFLIHSGDINVAKRIIYEEGRKHGNLNVKEIYQEFLIAYAHLHTKKQILPNMDSFLYLVPYSANPDSQFVQDENGLITEMWLSNNTTEVSTMLLSPSQRVFTHNITDVWTSLWHINRLFTRSNRFNHKNVAEKLLLSLQCYKPEALSRANTPGPMSPSSPLICTSLGDIAGMFGRRSTELQLPFVEHESCTANKQEYIFSINLRELSMHLLKERKEWPLHGHTVAGKYVCALSDTARLLCHLLCLTVHLQPTKNRDKGFKLIDTLDWSTRLRLFMLMEMYSLALGTLACPLPQGFTPFFAYLGYRVLKYGQFLWHVRSGTFDLQIDLVKTIMGDLNDNDEENVAKKLQLLTLLPKSRANRVLNGWSHPISVCLRARQHSSDLLSGVISQNRKRMYTTSTSDKKKRPPTAGGESNGVGLRRHVNPLDTFFQLLTAKANASDIDLGLLTEATMISMEKCRLEGNFI